MNVAADALNGILSDDLLHICNSALDAVGGRFESVLNASEAYLRSGAEYLGQFYTGYSTPLHLEFSELQTTLLSVFLGLIGLNALLIWFYWHKYGGVITDRFIRPSTLKEIEELKLSVAKLKLPIEHTPRL